MRISELAKRVGLSRTALLYYEKQGLINGRRLSNGYRVYQESDVQRLLLLQNLMAGGLTLAECKACLDSRLDRTLLSSRLQQLDAEIARKQQSRQLLAALLGDGDLSHWHRAVEQVAPDAHRQWLFHQGFSEKEALRLTWLSKDMNEHDAYMADFMHVFSTLDRWGPGSETDTLKALAMVPHQPRRLLEIGCGKGIATSLLLSNTEAKVIAVDNEESALHRLHERINNPRLTTVCASMIKLPFEPNSVDLIWCEGSAYIMGVEHALAAWKPLLEEDGILVFSDLVWLTDTPADEAAQFWSTGYPDMKTVAQRTADIEGQGYQVLNSFGLSKEGWIGYFEPLRERATALRSEMADSAALQDIERELSIYDRFLDQFTYQMFVVKLV